jgi:ABC-type nitrate/sulfonate/bicarbonate transport system substrate-binding protein
MTRSIQAVLCLASLVLLSGCGSPPANPAKGGSSGAGGAAPQFSLAWSEYPSWSVFGVAHTEGLIHGDAGQMGSVEKKWNVDIVLKLADYDPCLTMYGANQCDAVCITNMDILSPSVTRPGTAILPTSTSDGGDALVVVGIPDVKALASHKVYGLENSVSEYCFARNLEKQGLNRADYKFEQMLPDAAATAMQAKKAGFDAIMIWNPFVLQTLKTNSDAKVLFDSSTIPGEIVDMVVVGQDSLKKPGGREFACAIIDTYYQLNQKIEDPATRDKTLVALGAKFSNLNLEEMKTVVKQTKFYKTPEEGLEVFKGKDLPVTMKLVVDFCVKNDIIKESPKIGYSKEEGQLRFDPSYIEEVKAKGTDAKGAAK